MTIYATTAARALASLKRKGAAVTFTDMSVAFDAATGLTTPTPSSIAGYAIEVRGKPDQYKALGLIEATSPTLLFAPTTLGSIPKEGARVTWGGLKRSVVSVNPVSPDGTGLLARVIVASVAP